MERKDISQDLKWDLTPIIADDAEWQSIYDEAVSLGKQLENFRDKLTTSDSILQCLKLESRLSRTISRIYVYAKMRWDEDARDDKFKAMSAKAENLSVAIGAATAFIVPQLVSLDKEFLLELSKRADFADFSYQIQELARSKQHILSEKEEIILANAAAFTDNFHTAFSMFDNADVKFDSVKDEKGKTVEMSHGMYSLLLQSSDRKVRKDAYVSMFKAFKGMINTLSEIYGGNVKKNNFYAKVRGYGSALERAVDGENVTKNVYLNLVEAVDEHLFLLHDYMALRKDVLKLKKLAPYDLHSSLFEGKNISLEYKDACKLVKKALAPLGQEYANLLSEAFDGAWIDVMESNGKRSGAYSWGTYDAHPYVLLNYQKTTHDVFTIAHELGHAMHSYYSNKNQCYDKAGYEIFVAEVASTVNEVLLLKYLIANSEGTLKKYLLSYYLDMFRTTLFRQTQFAEFEYLAHKAANDGVSLTPDFLCSTYLKLNEKYYGSDVESDDLISCEWARIPHFYTAFYVYKYATGIASAVIIANRILSDENALDDYKKFLSAGGSTDPVTILTYAGVDLTQKSTLDRVFNEFDDTLKQLKALI